MVVWSDNQAVVSVLNSYKPHPTTVGSLRALVSLQAAHGFAIHAAFIPTELNTTSDWLSRITYSA